MSAPLALSTICGMSERRRSTSVSGPNISPAAIRGRSAYETCPVAPVTTTFTVRAMSDRLLLRAEHGLGLHLDEDLRVDEVDTDDRRGRPDITEEFAVRDRDVIDVPRLRDVDPRHDHVVEGTAELFDRPLHDVERVPHLLDDVVGHDLPVVAQASGACDADVIVHAHCARVAELELVLGAGAEGAPRFGHRYFILRMTASANSFVPTAVGSLRSFFRS